jgi:DNA ligase-1
MDREDIDKEKYRICEENSIFLIQIPYWWDNTIESLGATLHFYRPDLFPMQFNSKPIPKEPVPLPINSHPAGKPLPLMHGRDFRENDDPTNWLMSEKLDGVRAYWNGMELFSRVGKPMDAPEYFIKSLPKDHPLDGELWGGYHLDPQQVSSMIKSQDWSKLEYHVFDAPLVCGNYPERHKLLIQILSESDPHIKTIPYETCKDITHLMSTFNHIIKKKGEGVILYHPTSHYIARRTNLLLKLRQPRKETIVKFIRIGYNSYSLICEQRDGMECKVKCLVHDYLNPPEKGTFILVSYHGIWNRRKILKSPTVRKIRDDIRDWDQSPETE